MKIPHFEIKNPVAMAVTLTVLLLAVIFGATSVWYAAQLRPVSDNGAAKTFVVRPGANIEEIATGLEKQELIKSSTAFELYIKMKRMGGQLQAGTYSLSANQSVPDIALVLTKGKTSSQLVTILPGKRVDQIRSTLINAGFEASEVDEALDPATYAGMPIMQIKPENVLTLEGLLWPDSFQKDETTKPQDIIKQSLQATEQRLTPQVKAAFAAHGLTPYQGLTLASIVEREIANDNERPEAAQVFYLRLAKGMSLGADATAYYGAAIAGVEPTVFYDSPYNTRNHAGIPPTPISTIHQASLDAVVNPAKTDWLFFVTGDDGKTYFTKTDAEHQQAVKQHCQRLCQEL